MKPLHCLKTSTEVSKRLDEIIRHRLDLRRSSFDGPRPPLAARREDPKLGVAWLASRKLDKLSRTASPAP